LDAYRRTELDRWICDLHHDEAGIHRSVSVRGICMTQTLFVLASHSKTGLVAWGRYPNSEMMTMQICTPTISANLLANIVAELRSQGAAVDRLLRKHVGYAGGFADPYEQIPLVRFVNFLEGAAHALGDPLLGAKLGARSRVEDLGLIGLIFLASTNLQIALSQLRKFFPVLQGATRVELDARCAMPEFIYQILGLTIWPRRQDAELTLSATCSAIRSLLGECWSPVEVHFEHDRAHRDTREIDSALWEIFRAPVLFNQPANRLILEPRDLVRPVAPRGEGMVLHLERHLKDLMRTKETTFDSCAAQVSHVISKRLGQADLEVNSIAAEMGLSPRTLQRRLAEEGTSLRDLVRRHRSHIVGRLLKDPKTKMTVIAHDVGYADATTFSRAFKSWSGETPRDQRVARVRR
jgi:AraC-like DNA-binding protein